MCQTATNSFKKGWGSLKNKDTDAVKHLIKQNLSLTTDSAFYKRLRGEVEHSPAERKAIVIIFEMFDIKEVWGE